MKRIFLSFFFFLLFAAGAFSQSRTLYFDMAEKAYKAGDYVNAVNYYLKVLDDSTKLESIVLPFETTVTNLKIKNFTDTTKKTGNAAQKASSRNYDYILHRIAHSFWHEYDYNNAAKYFGMAAARSQFPEDKYYYGYALMLTHKYEEAITQFETYAALNEKNDSLAARAQHNMASCYFALDEGVMHKQIRVNYCDSNTLNYGTANFAPMFYNGTDKLIITSARKGGVLMDPDVQDSRFICDLYYSSLTDTGWTKPKNFGRPVNSGLHDGAAVITPDETMFYTRWPENNTTESYIYMAKTMEGKFFESMKLDLNVNVVGYKAMHPFLSVDGSKLFFSSNKPGGKGGMDLWWCNIDPNGITDEPKNLTELNTVGDEVSPFFHHVSSTLFFASNGHVGIGGLDIFKSTFNVDDSTFAFPKNMGEPINSSNDDAYFIIDKLQQKGYFASDRQPCEGGHCYDIYEFVNEPIIIDLDGFVYDMETNEVIPNATVTIRDVHFAEPPFSVTTDEKGHYFTKLKGGMEYFLKSTKKGYFANSASADTRSVTETIHLNQDFFLGKIPEGEIAIEGIEYDLNKATLRPKSKEVLDKIYDILALNESIHVEINSHTDTRGSEESNQKLAQARAESCVNYLISKGIPMSRMIPKGYGESAPLIPDSEIEKVKTKPEKEALHQKNRRTTFKVTAQ